MPKFMVDIVRIGYSCRVIEVEAEDEGQAADLALEMAPNFIFSETESEYECQSCEVVTPVEEKGGENNAEVSS